MIFYFMKIMNYTGYYNEDFIARNLNFKYIPLNKSPISEWKGHALRISVLAVGFGICVLLFRKKGWFDKEWWKRMIIVRAYNQDQETQTDLNYSSVNSSTEMIQRDDRSMTIDSDNDEVCPICLNSPKIGVKTPCGHLLCVECLASYCDVRITPAPPPCPLCRAPLNSVTLACDLDILDSNRLDINTVRARDWIRKYNNHRGSMMSVRPFLKTQLVLFFNLLILFLIIGLIVAKLQVFTEI